MNHKEEAELYLNFLYQDTGSERDQFRYGCNAIGHAILALVEATERSTETAEALMAFFGGFNSGSGDE